jgi:luciferase family oxidoreductase group 1
MPTVDPVTAPDPQATSSVEAPLALSVLDLVPVRTDQTTAEALAATRSLAQVADAAGYRRYWLAEHHNMAAVAATNPPVLISLVASVTSRIRVGSGGVMLPNHAPLVVAEQFALLEAAFPGRIDLGIGRAPGSDPVTSWALRHGAGGVSADAVQHFDSYVDDVIAMMGPDGVGLDLSGRTYVLTATPKAESTPPVWLLGSSDYSARLAAAKGLPYVFAHHFSGRGTAEALALYRKGFVARSEGDRPRTFLTVNAVVAPTTEDAERLALPQLQAMVRLRTGQELKAQELVEVAEATRLDPQNSYLLDQMHSSWVIGDPQTAATRIRELAAGFGVDEVMVHPVAGAVAGTAPDSSPAREQTLRLLADALTGGDRAGSVSAD